MDINAIKCCDRNDYPSLTAYVRSTMLTYNNIAKYACYSGNSKLIQYLIHRKKGVDWNDAIFYAILNGDNENILLLIPKISNYNEIFKKTCYLGNKEIMEYIIKHHLDKINLNHGLLEASAKGIEDVIYLLIKYKANDIFGSLRILAKYGHTIQVGHMIRMTRRTHIQDADILRNYAVLEACRYGHDETFDMFVKERVLFDIDRAFELADEGGHDELRDKIADMNENSDDEENSDEEVNY